MKFHLLAQSTKLRILNSDCTDSVIKKDEQPSVWNLNGYFAAVDEGPVCEDVFYQYRWFTMQTVVVVRPTGGVQCLRRTFPVFSGNQSTSSHPPTPVVAKTTPLLL